MKKRISMLLAAAMMLALVSCGNSNQNPPSNQSNPGSNTSANQSNSSADGDTASDYHIAIITGSVSQSEDDRRGAEAFQAKYGEDMVKLDIYPDNFTEELETTIQKIVNMADDPLMKAIIVNQAVPGTTEAFRQVKEKRPDILCIAGEGHEDLPEIGSAADLVCNNDFVSRGYLIIRTAHELGADTFVHISFPRHMAYETMSRRVAVMEEACKEFNMKFELETAPDPTSDVGIPGAQAYILENVPAWVEKYGEKAAYFCTNDAHTEPLLKQLFKYGGYFIEADLPSPLMGYPGALGLDLSEEAGDFAKILAKVESSVCATTTDSGVSGEGRFGTWAYSYGYTLSAGLAEHAKNVIDGKAEITDMDAVATALKVYSPEAEWNGAGYTNATTGVKSDNVFLIYQDTYIMGNPGKYMGSTSVEIPEKYYTVS
ncbi:MAG: DUF3798 domain-containing protein [Lawsonibacter sp.]|nr:DUF3798 domain-containing protein [Lawsonibacter sp.]